MNFFTDFKKVKFKSYNTKNCSLSREEFINTINEYRGRPFNDRIVYLEVYTSNRIEGNTLTKGQTKALLEGLVQDADCRTQSEVIQLNRAIRDNLTITQDLTIDEICRIHRDITYNTLNNPKDEGNLRSE